MDGYGAGVDGYGAGVVGYGAGVDGSIGDNVAVVRVVGDGGAVKVVTRLRKQLVG